MRRHRGRLSARGGGESSIEAGCSSVKAHIKLTAPPVAWIVGAAAAVTAGMFAAVEFGATAADKQPGPAHVQVSTIEVNARAIDRFDRARPDQQRFGRLQFRGGLVLTSPAKDFGGYSALAVEPDGRRFLAISDEGTWLTGEITYDGTKPKGMANAKVGPLLGLGGRVFDRKRDLDAESLTLLEGTLGNGTLLIGFERNHRIGRFPINGEGVQAPTGYLKLPPDAKRMRANNGFEAVTVVQGGSFKGMVVAFSERLLDAQKNHTGWIWQQGEPRRFSLRNIGDFEVTDAAALPDGSLIVLERRFRWSEGVKMRLRLIRAAGAFDGEVLLEADSGYEIDNMEGLAVHQGARGETVLTLISDDNFNSLLQRTLLLQFTLLLDAQAATEGSR